MVYTQEQLMKAVRQVGRTGQPFSVGEVRVALGLKSKDKRELKRFRSRLRECIGSLGDQVEKHGPHSYRFTNVTALAAAPAPAVARREPAPPQAQPVSPQPEPAPELQPSSELAARAALKERVGITPRAAEPTQRTLTERATAAQVSLAADGGAGLGSRVSAWLARVRGKNQNTAATALSRLALDLQPKATHFQYQWVDGDLQVKRQ